LKHQKLINENFEKVASSILSSFEQLSSNKRLYKQKELEYDEQENTSIIESDYYITYPEEGKF
jgi:hypothetical protein